MPYASTPTVEVYKNGDKIYQSKSGSIVILDNNKKNSLRRYKIP